MDELIDIYDENKQPLGITVPREGAFMQEGQFMLYVLAIIENQEGKFLITQRSLDKHWAAGWWETTGGCVSAGETSAQGVQREIAEEVGLDASGLDLQPIHSYKNVDLARGDNYIVDIYHARLAFGEQDVTLQESEAIDCKLATWEDICRLHEEGIFLHFNRIQTALQAEKGDK
ncbi:MAG: NUDIX domain-containing protein [Coriobacteriia bacterium]|nr:NUDIX domain-containing protein [Coriobacteriia bacterium]